LDIILVSVTTTILVGVLFADAIALSSIRTTGWPNTTGVGWLAAGYSL
jgi:hypothetical protein